jgi:hypothetical protein
VHLDLLKASVLNAYAEAKTQDVICLTQITNQMTTSKMITKKATHGQR